ncbi:MAG TPA: hypothetical protein VMV46_10080 [Thermoanaerobaculia bacterium]|nr:hypothetical protein [Thermoanaerobaculia bacterium]
MTSAPQETPHLSRPSDVRYRVEQTLYHAAMAPLRRCSHRTVGAIGEWLGILTYLFLPGSGSQSLANLRLVFPERTESELRRIARRSYAMFGRVFLEQISALRFSKQELLERFQVVGEEHLDRAWGMGRGLILVTGHLGAFDLAAFPVTQRIGPCHAVVRPPSNPYLRAEFERAREPLDTVLVPRVRSGHRLYNLLRKRQCIGLTIDQRVRPWDGILIDFLGHSAWTSPVPAFLAWKSRAPALPLFCFPEPGGRYRLEIHEPIVVEEPDYDPAEVLRRLNAPLEREILAGPEHWFWPHDRWKLSSRHRQGFALERIRRESRLDAVLGRPRAQILRPHPSALSPIARVQRADHLWVRGPANAVRNWARALGELVLDAGFAVRAIAARELTADLVAAPSEAATQRALHDLDAVALLLVEGADSLRDPAQLARLADLLEHRRTRGSVALLAADDRAGELDAEGIPVALRRFAARARVVTVEPA